MNRFLTLLTAFAIAITSCDKSYKGGDDDPPEKEGTQLFETVADNGNTVIKETFYYDSDSLVVKLMDTSWPTLAPTAKDIMRKLEYQRDNNKKVSKIFFQNWNNPVEPVVEFVKENGHHLVIRQVYQTQPDAPTEQWIGVDNKNRIVTDTLYNPFTKAITDRRVFTYDANDNIVSEEIFLPDPQGVYVSAYLYTYTYDNKKNPFNMNDRLLVGLRHGYHFPFLTKNNLLTITYLNKMTGNTVVTRNFQYTYNSNDLPVTRFYDYMGMTEHTTLTYR